MTRFLIFAACVLALLTTISVLAQDPQGQPGPRRRGGHNGEKRMKSMDINNDGVISREEFGDVARRQGGRLNQMDTNNDGKISRDEWKGNPKRFDRLDANGDGVITKEEIRGAHQNR